MFRHVFRKACRQDQDTVTLRMRVFDPFYHAIPSGLGTAICTREINNQNRCILIPQHHRSIAFPHRRPIAPDIGVIIQGVRQGDLIPQGVTQCVPLIWDKIGEFHANRLPQIGHQAGFAARTGNGCNRITIQWPHVM